ncbi:concanavalin A-like lectin/glucanase [Heliocybe sulcata]|uniref:Concanavalin A-like lectin/glucanase n=1 Tax=Heliocybe sulcata TaxID=5364 RepID=A0A5C3MZQ4_9AGAM|nr:concanavalin A-like lectin/glucanase [Heliocybe sulcata]
MLHYLILAPLLAVAAASAVSERATSSCPCGYRDSAGHIWRESIKSNLATSNALSVVNQDWAVQTWGQQRDNVYMQYSADNVYNVQNVLGIRTKAWSGNGSVYTGEIQTNRADIQYGSFRIKAKIPTAKGACFGFFSYQSDTQESDIEFLTNDTNFKHTVHYSNQPNHQTVTASADFTAFTEHRFDWMPGQTTFYVNGAKQTSMTANTPTAASRILANVWSDGDPNWSMGPPKTNAVALIQYINLYFNSTSYDATHFASDCKAAGSPAVCQV